MPPCGRSVERMTMQTNLYQQDHKKYIEVVREHFVMYGKEKATIQELLALVIGGSAKDHVCYQLSKLSIRDLYSMTAADFSSIEGISKTIGERLEAAVLLAKKLGERNLPKMKKINSPEDGYELFKYLQHEEQEQFIVAFLNTKNEVIAREVVFKGTLNASIVHPREIFRIAVQKAAASIIIAHQHPSGHPEASSEDLDVTKRLVEAGRYLGIDLLDHLIIGDGKYISLKEKGYV